MEHIKSFRLWFVTWKHGEEHSFVYHSGQWESVSALLTGVVCISSTGDGLIKGFQILKQRSKPLNFNWLAPQSLMADHFSLALTSSTEYSCRFSATEKYHLARTLDWPTWTHLVHLPALRKENIYRSIENIYFH